MLEYERIRLDCLFQYILVIFILKNDQNEYEQLDGLIILNE